MGNTFSSEPVVDKETDRDHNDTYHVAVSSCQGWRMSQEDNHSMILRLPGDYDAAFFAVYDGHGSAKVSKHASEALWRHLTQSEEYKKGNFKAALEKAFLTFDQEVNESYNALLAGTTAVCFLIVDNIIYCANIGDSRAVASVNCECVPLSYDHKPENTDELRRILKAGGYVLGNRINGNLALSRAFGDFHYKGNEDLPPEQQIVSPYPDITTIELNDDVDFLVLACDGIWDVLSSEEVIDFVYARLEQNMEPGLICEELTTECLATDYQLIVGCDNMTVLLVCYTRGRSWEDYCSDLYNKNRKRFGTEREGSHLRSRNVSSDETLLTRQWDINKLISDLDVNKLSQNSSEDTDATLGGQSSKTSAIEENGEPSKGDEKDETKEKEYPGDKDENNAPSRRLDEKLDGHDSKNKECPTLDKDTSGVCTKLEDPLDEKQSQSNIRQLEEVDTCERVQKGEPPADENLDGKRGDADTTGKCEVEEIEKKIVELVLELPSEGDGGENELDLSNQSDDGDANQSGKDKVCPGEEKEDEQQQQQQQQHQENSEDQDASPESPPINEKPTDGGANEAERNDSDSTATTTEAQVES